MKCLSLWQPWASLMAAGKKSVETRGWPLRYRGPLLIHAAKKWNADLAYTAGKKPFRAALEAAGIVFDATETACRRGWNLPFGCIIGAVTVVECYPTERVEVDSGILKAFQMPTTPPYLGIGPTERAFGDYSPGRFAFLCRDAFVFPTPIPFRGAQGLFDVADEVIEDGCKVTAPAGLF